MATFPSIEKFLALRNLAIVGASRNRGKYGNIVYRDLRAKGYRVFAVNPKSKEIEGDPCYPDLQSIPEKIEGVVIIVPPRRTENVVREVDSLGIVINSSVKRSSHLSKFVQHNGGTSIL